MSVAKFCFVDRLGKKIVWLVYFSLGLCLAFSLFYLASYVGLSFFVLSSRGMVEHVVGGSLVSVPSDIGVWSCAIFIILAWLVYRLDSNVVGYVYRVFACLVLIGLAIWVCLVILGMVSLVTLTLVSALIILFSIVFAFGFFGVSRFALFLRLCFGAVLVALFVEVTAFALFNFPVALNLGFGTPGLHWENVELGLSNLAYPFLPYLYFLLVLLGVAAFFIKCTPAKWLWAKTGSKRFVLLLKRLSGIFQFNLNDEFDFLNNRFVLILAVVVSAVISCLFVVFTVLPWTNPTNMLVSADSPSYYQWIVFMRSMNVNGALSFAFANDRALFLILAYALSYITSPLNVVQFAAALLIVLFGVVSVFVLKLFSSFRGVWVLGVLLVPFSFQALDLIYSGYFANMLALILVFVYIVLFFRFVGSWSNLGFLALLGVSVLILFSHSWSWFIFVVSLLVYLFLEWRSAVRNRGLWGKFKIEAIFVGATVEVGFVADFIRKLFSPVSSSTSVFATVQSSLGFFNIDYVLSGMRNTVNFVLGGVFANQLLVFLSVIGFFVLLRVRSAVSNFLVSWIFVVCVSILFAAENLAFDRFLFLVPWVVLSSLGLFSIAGFVSSRIGDSKGSRTGVLMIILVCVFLVLLNNSLRYLFNINVL